MTELKADKIMYKACPTEKCNKMVNDVGPGSYKCEKCRQEFPEFQWRYIVRGAIADATSYQVITYELCTIFPKISIPLPLNNVPLE